MLWDLVEVYSRSVQLGGTDEPFMEDGLEK